MRPLELKLRNFRSYFGGDAQFDFRGLPHRSEVCATPNPLDDA